MAKVYEFPISAELPIEVKETLYDIAKAYVDVLDYAFNTLSSEDPSLDEMDELHNLVMEELEAAFDAALFDSTFK